MKRNGFRVIDILSIFKTQGRCSHGCRSVLMSLSSSTIGIRKRPVTAKKEQWKWLDSVHRACDSVTSSLNDNLSPESHGPIECPTITYARDACMRGFGSRMC